MAPATLHMAQEGIAMECGCKKLQRTIHPAMHHEPRRHITTGRALLAGIETLMSEDF